MTILKILTYPDKFLTKTVAPVEEINDEVMKIINDMAETMYDEPGIGLAASQVGIDKQIIVYDISSEEMPKSFQALVNPEIISKEGSILSESEGCLSVPDYRADVKRHETIRVTGLDMDGNALDFVADGMLSIVLQHEIDHLNGILFIDRISVLKREIYKRKIKKEMKRDREQDK
jgi:peptide deformylase